jgi:hypothetical protein
MSSFALLDNITVCGRVFDVLKCFAVFLPMSRTRYAKEEPRESWSVQQAAVCDDALECCVGTKMVNPGLT